MKTNNFIYRILDFFSLRKPRGTRRAIDPMIPAMMKALEITEEREFSCEEVNNLIDQYAELALRGEPVEELFPLIKIHLELCRDCLEEYEGLLRVLAAA